MHTLVWHFHGLDDIEPIDLVRIVRKNSQFGHGRQCAAPRSVPLSSRSAKGLFANVSLSSIRSAGIAINGIGPDPEFDAVVCKVGPATPGICGRIRFTDWPRPAMAGLFETGDVGAPVIMDGRLVGLAYDSGWIIGSRYRPPTALTNLTKFSAILADVNAGDGPGSGFVPIGS